jgi:predicted HAD superfamily Cof-like phosphohydrolase
MSQNWVQDIKDMHTKFGVREATQKLSPNLLAEYLDFRIKFLQEELDETKNAVRNADAEEVVDGLIDLCVVAIGTLDAYGVDAEEAWNKVLIANMAKEVGVKESRPNPYGLPDLVKPEGWKAPSHHGNHGIIEKALD